MNRKEALRQMGLLGLTPMVSQYIRSVSQHNSRTTRPNMVLVLCDQFRADACKREGFELDTTPFPDRLAEDGTWFDKSYCAFPACVPSRTAMLTGRTPNATRVKTNWNIQDATYSKSLIDVLNDQKYKTGIVGKTGHSFMHLHPEKFDYFKTYTHLGEPNVKDPEIKKFNKFLHNTHFYADFKPAPFPPEMEQPSRIVTDGMNWLRTLKNDNNPFFLYLSIPEPHNPYQVPEPYYSLFPPDKLPPLAAGKEVLKIKGKKFIIQHQLEKMGLPGYEKHIPRIRSNYYGMMRLIDDQMKRFFNFLKKEELYDNTIFLFVADHGDYTGEYGLIKKGAGVPDCLTRIPMLWHGPGILKNKHPHKAHVSNIDIMPTICDIIGHKLPDGVIGRSLWPMLQGKDYPEADFSSIIVQQGFGGRDYTSINQLDPYKTGCLRKDQIGCDELNSYSQSGILRMLRKEDWKLEYNMQGNGRMYNLKEDKGEVHDLYHDKKYEAKKLELLQDMMAWELRTQDPLPLPRQRYVYRGDSHNYWTPYNDPDVM